MCTLEIFQTVDGGWLGGPFSLNYIGYHIPDPAYQFFSHNRPHCLMIMLWYLKVSGS